MDTEGQRYLELGDFIKTRRGKILPSQVGLPSGLRRRTPGLRREEVAQLTGIGLTWYTWLEQGRPIRVSSQVLESLARVLLLDPHERDHLFTLARHVLPSSPLSRQSVIKPSVQRILDSLQLSPALIIDQRWNVIAWNNASSVVFGDFDMIDPLDRNIVSMIFTDNSYMSLFIDWEFHARGMLARFRTAYGQHVDDPWFAAFIENLKIKSNAFREWWPQHEAQNSTEVNKELKHPIAGKLVFESCSFALSDNPNLKMIVNTPLPETDTAEKVRGLSAM